MKGLAILAAALLSLPANAQPISCGDRMSVVAKLSSYGEVQAGLGLNRSGVLMEIWASAETGTWTIVMTQTDGRACIVSYGENWTGAIPAVQDKPA